MGTVNYESIQLCSRHRAALAGTLGQPQVKMTLLFKGSCYDSKGIDKSEHKIAGILTYRFDYFKTKTK